MEEGMRSRLERVDPVGAAQEVVRAHQKERLTKRAAPAATAAAPELRASLPQYPNEPWGLATSIDIYDCDPATIRDAESIRHFVAQLCDLIEMKRFGETIVIHFGEDERVAGYSMVQLIETSLISAHFANLTNTVYLDVFSCKMYEPDTVAEFARAYFGGGHFIKHVTTRL
jgi:S-adenosylmethionine/arginine decarboxylase-like enzyme